MMCTSCGDFSKVLMYRILIANGLVKIILLVKDSISK